MYICCAARMVRFIPAGPMIWKNACGPVELVYSEELTDKSEALKREYAIKQLSHTEKLKLIERNKLNTIY